MRSLDRLPDVVKAYLSALIGQREMSSRDAPDH
jgi:hypothetical protein